MTMNKVLVDFFGFFKSFNTENNSDKSDHVISKHMKKHDMNISVGDKFPTGRRVETVSQLGILYSTWVL